MTFLAGIIFEWDGDQMVPMSHYKRRCNEHLVVGERYRLDVRDVPSHATRSHYFAVLDSAWANLPESLAHRFPTRESLRKTALIHTGYRDERTLVLGSHAEAVRAATWANAFDEYAVITVDGNIVTAMTAKSQSEEAMGAAQFAKSKTDVLEFVSRLIGVDVETLTANVGQAA